MTGELPEGWSECKLEDFVNIYTGNSINEQDKVSKYTNIRSGYNYIATKDVGFDKVINYENGVKIPYENSSFKLAPAGTTLLCIEGGSAGRKVAYTNQTVCFGNKLCAFVTQFEKNSRYVYFFLQSSMFKSIFSVNKNGLIGGVSLNKIKKININLPPLAEQERIVEKIEELFSEIDEGTKNLKTAQLQLKQYRQSVLKSAFEGKLYKTTEWKKIKLNEYIQEINYGTSEKTKEIGKIPVLRMGDIQDGKLFFNNLKYLDSIEDKKLLLQHGDLLFNRTNSAELVGKSAVFYGAEICSFASYIIKVRLKQSLNSQYVCFYINSPRGKQWAKSQISQQVGQANINGSKLKSMELPLPSLSEQERIVEEIEKRFEVADEMEKAIKESLEDAQKLKQSILKKAFSGQLVPQNPDDEPASALLERIKASNSVKPKGKKQ